MGIKNLNKIDKHKQKKKRVMGAKMKWHSRSEIKLWILQKTHHYENDEGHRRENIYVQ